jgi:hypothetical protein
MPRFMPIRYDRFLARRLWYFTGLWIRSLSHPYARIWMAGAMPLRWGGDAGDGALGRGD